jgi:hypothetical protein
MLLKRYFNVKKRAVKIVSSNETMITRQKSAFQLTPWSRVLPDKLKCPKLLKKFPAFYGTRRFITAFT